MCRKKLAASSSKVRSKKSGQGKEVRNRELFHDFVQLVVADDALFTKSMFHGNIKWLPEQLAVQALIWSWQDSRNVTDAFEKTLEVCQHLELKEIAKNYTSFMNALSHYRSVFCERLRVRYQTLVEEVGGRYFRTNDWVLIAFDGSRATAPRTVANETAFCAPNYGHGKQAKYGKKKSKGLRRKRNQAHKTEPQEPQVWITLMWHMGLRLPWTWRLGPSNSVERHDVQKILEQEEFPEDTLFCGDAGFVGYPLWSAILAKRASFLVRVGANVNLLSEHADIQKLSGGRVLCWPKDKMNSGLPPLRLRLVKVKVGKTQMWMLTNVLDERELTKKQIVQYYKLRWGIEVEFRGLKQTMDNRKLRCRNDGRLLAELDWALRGMAIAELIALSQQIPKKPKSQEDYDPKDRSLARTVRAFQRCMRHMDEVVSAEEGLQVDLCRALVQRYHNRTDKRARYRPKNPDKKPLGDPVIRKLTAEERNKLKRHPHKKAA